MRCLTTLYMYGKQNLPFRSAFVFKLYVFQNVIVLLLSGIIYFFVFKAKTILVNVSQMLDIA